MMEDFSKVDMTAEIKEKPRSILKKAKSPTATALPPPAPSREARNRATALYHAQLIQERKDVEAQIFASLETLIDLPSSSTADPTHPSATDASLVKNCLQQFQPSDYDSLIEERNINKLCGYVLCPRPHREEDTKAKYRILHGRGKRSNAIKIVDRKDLETWCSDECGKRALYIKVQLTEEPAWTRTGIHGGDIMLLDEDRVSQPQTNEEAAITAGLDSLNLNTRDEQIVARMKALAIERDDMSAQRRSYGLGDLKIQEHVITSDIDALASEPTKAAETSGGSALVEGYRPRFSELTKRFNDVNDHEMRTI